VHVDAARGVFYVVNERGGQMGMVRAYRWDSAENTPALLSQTPSGGDDPCFLTLDPTGNYLLIANYSGQCVTICPVSADGTPGAICQTLPFTGSSSNKDRQTQSHPHSITFSPDGRFVYIPDLGADKIWVFRWLGYGDQPAVANEPAAVTVAPGSGPRMLCFAPEKRDAYVANELSVTITSYAYDSACGALTYKAETAILPVVLSSEYTAAHIATYCDTILVSIRGHNSITTLHNASRTNTAIDGKTPRHFLIDTAGQRLYVGNQNSDTIICFQLSSEGTLSQPQIVASIPAPSCLAINAFDTY
jgi:6-phosphogluconolactonase